MSKELIDRLKSYIPSGDGHNSQYANDLADAVAILEAKAAPVGEREAFEAWKLTMKPYGFNGFDAYQAGAAYQRAQQPQSEYGDAYQGAREDLAIWKRRALEAEARVRQQDQIIDQMGEDLNAINGPTFMGEPVLPRQQAREVVMPDIKELVHRFLACPLPESLCSDPCASMPGYPHRTGTNLMTAEQAMAMFGHVLAHLKDKEVFDGH